jgi:CHAT domain-containing protein
VEFAALDKRTWVFVITPTGAQVFKLPISNSALKQQVERFGQQLANRDLRIADSAQQLYKNVLGPASISLKNKKEIVIIPDGVLWNLPFQALQSRPNHYLIEDSAISYAPSLTALREMMKPRTRTNNQPLLLAFGNPTIGESVAPRRKLSLMDEHLAPLPEAEVQVKSVGKIYSPDSQVYIGREAREDRWKAEADHYRILHLATHGVLDDRSPMYSYLVLAPTVRSQNSEDGLLEAWEIMRMHLNADLVVLSACETAKGNVTSGEAVIGLTWAFFVAGSPATLVTQWKVETASSSVLMTDFHQRWKAGQNGMSKAKALQLAALQMLHDKTYSHPFYWAGYVLIGNGK